MNTTPFNSSTPMAPPAAPMQVSVTLPASENHPAPPSSNTALFAVAIEPPDPPQIGMIVRLGLLHVGPTLGGESRLTNPPGPPAEKLTAGGKGGLYMVKSNTLQSLGHVRLAFLHLRPDSAGAVGPKSQSFAGALAERLREVAYQRRLEEFYGADSESGGRASRNRAGPMWMGYPLSYPDPQGTLGAHRRPPVPLSQWRSG
ncbi:hypothetical protein BV20DRAFT_965414 [Pilatotrama ljubarskyi]|nr:hypothetical protein BV20DRAFT_965414 [Pilatotrama ljubarskyi]